MITLQDCFAMCDGEAEVLAIAEHEHIPEIAPAALTQYLLSRELGDIQLSLKPADMLLDACVGTHLFSDGFHRSPALLDIWFNVRSLSTDINFGLSRMAASKRRCLSSRTSSLARRFAE